MPKILMRYAVAVLGLVGSMTSAPAQNKPAEGPTNEKAQKIYQEAQEYVHKRMVDSALESFKKADKLDGGHCVACQQKMIKYGRELGDWKTVEFAAQEMITEAQGSKEIALAHNQLGIVLLEGIEQAQG